MLLAEDLFFSGSIFLLFYLQNPITYAGRHQLPPTLRKRCLVINVPQYRTDEMTDILLGTCFAASEAMAELPQEQRQEFATHLIGKNTATEVSAAL